jgi:hypothetical protein
MATSQPRDYVDRALRHLASALQSNLSKPEASKAGPAESRDLQAQLKSMLADWDAHYRERTPRGTKTRVHELLDLRNKWAHPNPQEVLDWSDAFRAANSALQLLRAVGGKNIKELEDLEHELIQARPVAVERPTRNPHAANLAELWLEADPDSAVIMRGALRCARCKKTVNMVVKRNPDALTDKRPRFLLFSGSGAAESLQVGHLFVGKILKSPVLYFGALKHCGDEQRVVVFFNRSFSTAIDPHLVVVPHAAGPKNHDDEQF